MFASVIRSLMVKYPGANVSVAAGVQPAGGVPANTSAEELTPPDKTFSFMAASCAESM